MDPTKGLQKWLHDSRNGSVKPSHEDSLASWTGKATSRDIFVDFSTFEYLLKTVHSEALMRSSKTHLILQIEAIGDSNVFLELKLFRKT